MKYIDADKLKALLSDIKEEYDYCKGDFREGIMFAINELEEEINASLQQEQDCIVINKKDWEVQEQFRKNKDFGKPLQEEKPEVDLEEEISTWIPAHIRGGDNEVWKDTKKAVTEWGEIVARHFYELGKNARKV